MQIRSEGSAGAWWAASWQCPLQQSQEPAAPPTLGLYTCAETETPGGRDEVYSTADCGLTGQPWGLAEAPSRTCEPQEHPPVPPPWLGFLGNGSVLRDTVTPLHLRGFPLLLREVEAGGWARKPEAGAPGEGPGWEVPTLPEAPQSVPMQQVEHG